MTTPSQAPAEVVAYGRRVAVAVREACRNAKGDAFGVYDLAAIVASVPPPAATSSEPPEPVAEIGRWIDAVRTALTKLNKIPVDEASVPVTRCIAALLDVATWDGSPCRE